MPCFPPLIPYFSSLIPHILFLTSCSPPPTLIPHMQHFTPNHLFLASQPSALTPHPSHFTPNPLFLNPHTSPLTPCLLSIAPHHSPLTPPFSPLTPRPLHPIPHLSPLTFNYHFWFYCFRLGTIIFSLFVLLGQVRWNGTTIINITSIILCKRKLQHSLIVWFLSCLSNSCRWWHNFLVCNFNCYQHDLSRTYFSILLAHFCAWSICQFLYSDGSWQICVWVSTCRLYRCLCQKMQSRALVLTTFP